MKKLPAVIAAVVTTVVFGIIMVAVGANALLTPTTVAAASAPADPTQTATADTQSAQIQQLQERIAQYQAREKQYQTQLNEATQQLQQSNTQLQQAGAELQQYQQLVQGLQQMGVIAVNSNGQIVVPSNNPRSRFRGDD